MTIITKWREETDCSRSISLVRDIIDLLVSIGSVFSISFNRQPQGETLPYSISNILHFVEIQMAEPVKDIKDEADGVR